MRAIPFLGFSEPLSSWTHLLAAGVSLVGLFFLLKRGRGNLSRMVALSIYSFSLIFLFSMSGTFHLLELGGTPRLVLQRLDHAGIWILIAGTFTPVHVTLFRGGWRWAILGLVWTIAITGLVLEVIFFTSFPEWLILTLFLGLGWLGALSGVKFKKLFEDRSLTLMAVGGICYSIGAVIDFLRWPVIVPGVLGPHEIFHIFVVLAALSHWFFIYRWADHPVANTVVFQVRIFPSQRFLAEAVGESLRLEADSLDGLKTLIKERVSERFHHSVQPAIHLKYLHEEHL